MDGFALAGYLNDLERQKKKAYGAVDTLNKESAASDMYQGAKSRTDAWLSSLSHEELAKINPEARNLSSNFENVGDVSRFDTTKRADELGLTSEFAGVDGIDDYLKSLEKGKEEKKTAEVDSVLNDITTGMQRNKKFSDLNELEKQAGLQPADYNLKSTRDIALGAGAPKYAGNDRMDKFMSTFVEKPEENDYKEKILDTKAAKNEKAPFNMVGARIKYDTPEYRDLINSQIDDSLASGNISQEQADFAKNQVNNGFAYDYGLSFMKNGVDASLKRGVKVADEYALIEPKVAEAAAVTGTNENTKRKIQADNPILSEAQGGALSDSYNAVNYLNTLKSALKNNNVGYFDIDRKTGQFVNPQAADAFLQLVEIVGRKRSGAAISEGEWKNFGKQILNKNNLLTDAGKKTAIEGLDRYLDKFYGAGVTTTGNEDWYNNYKGKSAGARQKAEGTPEPTATSATDKLKIAAKSGNSKAQAYLKSKGVSW